ncbi:MAG: hypothetical protein ACRCZI_04815, partial [Cetobacterium sp.]
MTDTATLERPVVPLNPPAVYFRYPTGREPRGIDDNPESATYGQVWYVVAEWDRCILDGQPGCWTARDLHTEDPQLRIVHQGDARLADGSLIRVGPVPGDGGHAPRDYTPNRAQAFYDNTNTQVARVRYQWHPDIGLVAAGVLWPEVMADPVWVAKLLATPVSLDARPIMEEGGRYALLASCLVNIPGLPNTRTGAAAPVRGEPWIVAQLDEGAVMIAAADSPGVTFRARSAELTEDVRRRRKQLHDRFRGEAERIRTLPVGRRTEARQRLTERRSAELEQLRAETAQQREQLRQERIRATDQLQARHS